MPGRYHYEFEEGRSHMSSLKSSVKHVRYVLGSLTAVLFATAVGSAF
jgi:hypothetical protein